VLQLQEQQPVEQSASEYSRQLSAVRHQLLQERADSCSATVALRLPGL
jgi:hypothetical protein